MNATSPYTSCEIVQLKIFLLEEEIRSYKRKLCSACYDSTFGRPFFGYFRVVFSLFVKSWPCKYKKTWENIDQPYFCISKYSPLMKTVNLIMKYMFC